MLYKDYRDFVFKNSKYIGELNEMYIQSSEIPWHQDKTSFSLATELDIIILKRFMQDLGNDEKNIRLLDIGCGLGYLTNRLKHELTDYTSIEIVAVDVSDNAIKKAKHEFKGIEFISLDMSHKLSKELGNFDIIFIAFWLVWIFGAFLYRYRFLVRS